MKTTPKKSILAGAALLAAVLVFPNQSDAQAIYSSGHGDIGAAYDSSNQQFEPHWHLHTGAVVNGTPLLADDEYAPVDLNARTQATRTSPTGLASTIGVSDGTLIYAAGSSLHQPNLGFGVEELAPGDWTTPITLTLTNWTLPSGAKFALYRTNLAGTSVVDRIFSTHSPSSTDFSNSFTMTPGDHIHFQWGFTQMGNYTLELTWSGNHTVDGAISTTESFTVQVVPEPSTIALLVIALGAVALYARRRQRAN